MSEKETPKLNQLDRCISILCKKCKKCLDAYAPCPKCGGVIMEYSRFVAQDETTKWIQCDECGWELTEEQHYLTDKLRQEARDKIKAEEVKNLLATLWCSVSKEKDNRGVHIRQVWLHQPVMDNGEPMENDMHGWPCILRERCLGHSLILNKVFPEGIEPGKCKKIVVEKWVMEK